MSSRRPKHEQYAYRRRWAREVFARLGFGLARDESGFYRPAKLARPAADRAQRLQAVEASRQMSLDFETPKDSRGQQAERTFRRGRP